jgi:hypothetical protein
MYSLKLKSMHDLKQKKLSQTVQLIYVIVADKATY